MAFASTSTEFAMIDARRTAGSFVLPTSSSIPGRILNIKDPYGAFTNSTITVFTAPGDLFEDGTNFRVLNNAFEQIQLYAASTTRWYVTGGTEQNITTTNIAVVSTVQTFNWPSLCNTANFGYASTFNPAAIGRISFLDNIFTSSTAALASTFIEMGNLNAQPFGMNPGGTFRWLAGVEQNPSATNGLDFKIKQWRSFGMVNSPLFYGANTSTLTDVAVWDTNGRLSQNGAMNITNTRNAGYGHVKLFPFQGGGETLITFYSTVTENNLTPWVIGRTGNFGTVNNFGICPIAGGGVNAATTTIFTQTGSVGIGAPAFSPAYTLDVNGIARSGMPVSSITGTQANIGLTGYGIMYYITNNGFNSLVLPSTDPAAGWFVTLRNNTGAYLSVTITGTNSKIPASPFIIPVSNAVTLAYDASPPSGGCNWVYF